MFMWREDNGLEEAMMVACRRDLSERKLDEMIKCDVKMEAWQGWFGADCFYSDLSTCSNQTKERGYEIYSHNHEGVDESGDLWSKKSFLRAIAVWFDETYG